MPPGQRMVELICRAAMLDNVEGIAKSAALPDPSRPLQAARLSALTDLHKQVHDIASALKAHMQPGNDT
eukprot:4516721-Pyramimonas_sp.AAC.1